VVRDSLGKWFTSEVTRHGRPAAPASADRQQTEFDIALLDIKVPGTDGMGCNRAREADPG
jgi:DNA-binding response OmpR family regulator